MRLAGIDYRFPQDGGFRLGPFTLEGPPNRPWLILGRTGSGKSTLLRLLGGALRGSAELTRGLPPEEDRGYLPQFPERVLTGRNLAEDLLGQPRPGDADRRRARELLRQVGLEACSLSRSARSLSAGEARRLALGLLIGSGRAHWSLDEPEAGLDARAQAALLELLAARRGEGCLWIATHRFEAYLPLHPWVVVLDEGQLVAAGELGEVLRLGLAENILGIGARAPFRVCKTLSRSRPHEWSNVVKKLRNFQGPISQVQSLLANS